MGRHVRITEGRGVPRIAMAGLDTRRRRKEPLLRRRARPLCPCRVCWNRGYLRVPRTCACWGGDSIVQEAYMYTAARRGRRGDSAQCTVGHPPRPPPSERPGRVGRAHSLFVCTAVPGRTLAPTTRSLTGLVRSHTRSCTRANRVKRHRVSESTPAPPLAARPSVEPGQLTAFRM